MNSAPEHILFLFVDGLGIGSKNPDANPFWFSPHFFHHFEDETFPKRIDPTGYVLGLDATLDVPGLVEPAVGRLISVPDRRVPMLNDLHLRRGRWLEAERSGEVLVSESFAAANQLTVGDRVVAVINSRRSKSAIAA